MQCFSPVDAGESAVEHSRALTRITGKGFGPDANSLGLTCVSFADVQKSDIG